MAIIEVKMLQIPESAGEVTMLHWKRKVGEAVLMDEPLVEVETDKVVFEILAPADGFLAEVFVGDTGVIGAGQLIARIEVEGIVGANSPADASAPAADAQTIGKITTSDQTRAVRSLFEVWEWVAKHERIGIAELRARLLPLDLLPSSSLDDLNERALNLTGEIALAQIGNEVLVTKVIFDEVLANWHMGQS